MEDFNKDCLAVCVHDEFCGGCVYQGMTYEEQLALKEGEVRQFFSDRGIKPEVFAPLHNLPRQSSLPCSSTGVELVEEAVEAAKVNAELNALSNCKFIAGDVFNVLCFLIISAPASQYIPYVSSKGNYQRASHTSPHTRYKQTAAGSAPDSLGCS